jgi:hypothetical protein
MSDLRARTLATFLFAVPPQVDNETEHTSDRQGNDDDYAGRGSNRAVNGRIVGLPDKWLLDPRLRLAR